MNRDKAKWRVRPQEEKDKVSAEGHDVLVTIHNAVIDEIYDDIEKKVCKNCIYHVESSGFCLVLDNYGMEYCSEFSKDNT